MPDATFLVCALIRAGFESLAAGLRYAGAAPEVVTLALAASVDRHAATMLGAQVNVDALTLGGRHLTADDYEVPPFALDDCGNGFVVLAPAEDGSWTCWLADPAQASATVAAAEAAAASTWATTARQWSVVPAPRGFTCPAWRAQA